MDKIENYQYIKMENKVYCFGYSRKSPDDIEDTEMSIKNQNELIETICKGKGWNLVRIFSDKNISGSERERKGIIECIKEARHQKVMNPKSSVYIIVKDQDRFARDYAFMGDTLKDLEAYGINVFSILKNGFLNSGDLGDIVMSVMNAQMIVESRKKAVLTIDKKIEQKLPCIPAPFGYKYFKKNWIIVPKEADVVRKVIDDYLNEINYKKTLSSNKISRGKYDRIKANAKKGLYNGIISFENKIKGSSSKVIRKEIFKYEGDYEHILSEEVFNKLNDKI